MYRPYKVRGTGEQVLAVQIKSVKQVVALPKKKTASEYREYPHVISFTHLKDAEIKAGDYIVLESEGNTLWTKAEFDNETTPEGKEVL